MAESLTVVQARETYTIPKTTTSPAVVAARTIESKM
jgi:hypothetical protein